MSQIRDISLASQGEQRIAWVACHMPLLLKLEETFSKTKPFQGKKIAVSVHLEAKTARLCRLLHAAGATLAVTGSNPLSTRDDIAAALAAGGIEVFAWYNATAEEYHAQLQQTLAFGPDLIIDDGGDFVQLLHSSMSNLAPNVLGGCEETTTGVLRMRARANAGQLKFPMFAVNDADCKHLFDNRFGTGQSVWDSIMAATNLLIAGKTVVVAGFGHCGLGVAERAKGLGARVIVTEIDPVRALEAHMSGFEVMTMNEAAPLGDFFVTVTGNRDIITKEHFLMMKDGVLLSNAGHFDVEIDVAALRSLASDQVEMRKDVMGYLLPNGKTVCLMAEGRLVNVGAGSGHPAEIMDMSFAVQTLTLLHILQNAGSFQPIVYDVPKEMDQYLAKLKLECDAIQIDTLTQTQINYLNSSEGIM